MNVNTVNFSVDYTVIDDVLISAIFDENEISVMAIGDGVVINIKNLRQACLDKDGKKVLFLIPQHICTDMDAYDMPGDFLDEFYLQELGPEMILVGKAKDKSIHILIQGIPMINLSECK